MLASTLVGVFLIGFLCWTVLDTPASKKPAESHEEALSEKAASDGSDRTIAPEPASADADSSSSAGAAEDSATPEPADEQSEEEKAAEAEAKLVDAFDAMTDTWMEPSDKGVTMAEIDRFVKQFKQVPKARQDECLHRALNLVPDENVMLLAGILMDKTVDKELVELVFNDILNRDEDVKKPILQQVYKDKSHPCWADVAWILDVTGEKPEASTAPKGDEAVMG